MREAKERELYIQYFFSYLGLIRLYIRLKKDIYKRIRGSLHVYQEHARFKEKKGSEKRQHFDMVFQTLYIQ